MRRRLAWAIASAYALALALLVFTPISGQLSELTTWIYDVWTYRLRLPGHPTSAGFADLLNVVLFVPLGVLVVLIVRWGWLATTALAVAVSCSIELVQAVPFVHRYASLTDVVTNGIGGFLGAVGATLVLWWHRRGRAAS